MHFILHMRKVKLLDRLGSLVIVSWSNSLSVTLLTTGSDVIITEGDRYFSVSKYCMEHFKNQ